MDLFVVPTISFQLLYGLLILRHDRRRVLWMGVTAHPTAEWIARQLTETYGWDQAPTYLLRHRDQVYGQVFTRACARHGYSRSTNFAAIAMAKCLCRTAGRLDPTRMRRSYRGSGRPAPSSHVAIAHELLQRSANTSVLRQGCSGITRNSCRRPDSSDADPRWSPPRVRPDLICGRDSLS